MGDKFGSPDFSSAVAALCILVRGSTGLAPEEEDEEEQDDFDPQTETVLEGNPYALPGEKIEMSNEELLFFTSLVSVNYSCNNVDNV